VKHYYLTKHWQVRIKAYNAVERVGPVAELADAADLKSAAPASEVNELSKTYDDEQGALGVLLGELAAKSPDLALIIERWEHLPEPVKTGIMAMVKSVKGEGA